MEKSEKIYLTYYNLLIVLDLWQAHCQLLSINFSGGINRTKCKNWYDDKRCENCRRIEYMYCDCFLEYPNFTNFNLIEYRCLCCNKNYQHKFDEILKEQFFKILRFSNHVNNKFVLLLQKGIIYLYEYTANWEKFYEISLPEKEDCYCHLNMEDITDADYTHTKRVCEDFERKNLREHHN